MKFARYIGRSAVRLAFTTLAVIGLFTMLASAVDAHEAGASGGLVSGLTHPLVGLDHVVAMVAVGLWGGQLKQPAIWLLPVTFPIVMAVGGVLGARGVPLPFVEVGIAASAVVLGVMVAAAIKPPLWVAAVVVILMGLLACYLFIERRIQRGERLIQDPGSSKTVTP